MSGIPFGENVGNHLEAYSQGNRVVAELALPTARPCHHRACHKIVRENAMQVVHRHPPR